ncbi:tRNA (adenosine(37)-N6)-threonylcarbamoyltransferase complex ATPase subunit type 1 TsaE [Metamycoplasma gateae]|uniref:tRNA threonylcarbamoyladenosine biosynthesis protein TsaE n=1 Tax=Metamycoplasma gateae TaxID=35769 RepID=A0ABZ2AHC3_9BACT|nr:tRNA (adenosine(37)-N6)-threonylcarbamoyltransferase complex ATPase subunit type 1 TsaE [Metamycoplasma gateae]
MGRKFYFKENEGLDKIVNYLLSFKNLEAILLNGELGAGKTTLASSIAKKLGEKKTVVSPTFNTMICYDKIVHIDAYKLKGDLFAFEEFFDDKLVIIEWSKNINHNFKNFFEIDAKIEIINEEIYHVFEVITTPILKGLFVETSLDDFFVALVENEKIVDHIILKKLVKKTDHFFETIDEILIRNKISINDLNVIYTTKGPGSFTGSRLGFSFASTNKILQRFVNNNDLQIKLSPTYDLFFKQLNLDKIYIKANKYKAYKISKSGVNVNIELSDEIEKINNFDYSKIIYDFSSYVDIFSDVKDVQEEELVYASEPQIGGM